MTAATVAAAGVTLAVMMFAVMIAFDVGIEIQVACKIRLDSRITASADTAVKFDARFAERHLCAAADAAANENVCTDGSKKSRECAMTRAVGIENLCVYDSAVFDLIDLELLGMTEMLKDGFIFISNCNFHDKKSPFICGYSVLWTGNVNDSWIAS